MERRTFLRASAAAVAVGGPLAYVFRARESAESLLVPDANNLLDLAPGFSYQVIGRSGDRLSDGWRAPALPDGMACFTGADGSWILMRNHEVERDPRQGAFDGPAPSPLAHDPRAQGGVSRLVLDPETLAVRSGNMVLAGTLRNCAGGPSPWGWLSCEETVEEGHGYVFACPIEASSLVKAEPIHGYGRFRHEAVAIDPRTHVAYLTEDEGDGCLYRFVPDDPARPFTGKLQAMKVEGSNKYNTSERMGEDRRVRVGWVDVPDAMTPGDGSWRDRLRRDTLRDRAQEAGAAIVRRGEGIWYHEGQVFFTSTNGGKAGAGQVFRLQLARDTLSLARHEAPASGAAAEGGSAKGGSAKGRAATGTTASGVTSSGEQAVARVSPGALDVLELVAESAGRHELDGPDNVTVAPWGEVFVAEDGGGEQFIRAIDADGRIRDVARNANSGGELAGVCFSPDGSTLFFNLHREGLTVAVRGPWQRASA